MPRNKPLSLTANQNMQRTCSAPGCYNRRAKVGKYCQPHAHRAWLFGHPLGKRIRRKEYQVEREQVSTFIDGHLNHAAIKSALAWIDGLLGSGWTGEAIAQGATHWQRLGQHGVKPLAVLKEAASVFHYSRCFPNRLPDSDQRLLYAISLSVLSLAPKDTRRSRKDPSKLNQVKHPAEARRIIGAQLRATLAPLFMNISEALFSREQEKKGRQAALRTPFTSTAVKPINPLAI